MARLAGVVSELARGGHRPTVVHLGGKSGWAVLVYPTLAGGACVYLYCRVTGSSPLDLLFVSRGSMASFRHVVAEGLSNVWAELRRHKEEFVRMVTTLGSKQDQLQDSQQQLMERQAQMDTVLQRVRAAGAGVRRGACGLPVLCPARCCSPATWALAQAHPRTPRTVRTWASGGRQRGWAGRQGQPHHGPR